MFKERPRFIGRGRRDPIRKMVAGDLGLDLLKSAYDPVMLAAGIKVPRMSAKETNKMRFKAVSVVGRAAAKRSYQNRTEDEREQKRRPHNRSVEAKIIRQEVRAILQRFRNFGQVRNK